MRLETPPLLHMDGKVVPWSSGTVHIWSETAIRATNVFEGLRAYWNAERRCWKVLAWHRHMRRLRESARLLRIPHSFDEAYFKQAVQDLLTQLPYRQDMYVRPTIFVEHGPFASRTEDVTSKAYVVAFPSARAQARPQKLRCLVSSWQRAGDLAGMPRAKSGAIYSNIRLPRIEAYERGFDDAILLNQYGQVSELTGACIFLVRHGRIATPRTTDSILEGITRDVVIRSIARDLNIAIDERPIDRTELYIADEIFGAGTLSEISSVCVVDDMAVGLGEVGSITTSVSKAYDAIISSDDSGATEEDLVVQLGD
jgi:branched-chain amino acid aminotransferase